MWTNPKLKIYSLFILDSLTTHWLLLVLTPREYFWIFTHSACVHCTHIEGTLLSEASFTHGAHWGNISQWNFVYTVHVYIILTLREHFWVKPRLHTVHVYGLDPVWIRRCRFRSLLFRNLTKQHQSINRERYGSTSRASPSPYRAVLLRQLFECNSCGWNWYSSQPIDTQYTSYIPLLPTVHTLWRRTHRCAVGVRSGSSYDRWGGRFDWTVCHTQRTRGSSPRASPK